MGGGNESKKRKEKSKQALFGKINRMLEERGQHLPNLCITLSGDSCYQYEVLSSPRAFLSDTICILNSVAN